MRLWRPPIMSNDLLKRNTYEVNVLYFYCLLMWYLREFAIYFVISSHQGITPAFASRENHIPLFVYRKVSCATLSCYVFFKCFKAHIIYIWTYVYEVYLCDLFFLLLHLPTRLQSLQLRNPQLETDFFFLFSYIFGYFGYKTPCRCSLLHPCSF